MDAVSASGAVVLNLPFADPVAFGVGRIADPDAVARIAGRDMAEALSLFRDALTAALDGGDDWPDQLSAALRQDPNLRLEVWAAKAGLAPETVSRGFRQVFGTTPRRYRAEQRALRAAHALQRSGDPPAALAAELGFADQAHMSRAVAALTGLPPGRLRVKSVQS